MATSAASLIRGRRECVVTVVLALVCSFFLVAGYAVSHDAIAHADVLSFVISLCVFFLVAVLFFAVYTVMWRLLDAFSQKRILGSSGLSARLDGVMNGRYAWLGCWALLLVCWLPVLLAAWPGFYCYDTDVVEHWARDGVYDPNQPFLWVFCLGMVFRAAWALGLSSNAAIAFLSIACGVLSAALLARVVILVGRHYSPVFALMALAFFGCNPIIPCFVWGSEKDAYFAIVFVALLGCLITPACGKRSWLSLIALEVLCCLLRNNVSFALIACIPFVWVLLPERRKAYLVGLALAVAVAGIVGGPLARCLSTSVNPSPAYLSMSSVPTQHMAFIWNGDAANEGDRQIILGLVNNANDQQITDSITSLERNVPVITDVSRGAFMTMLMLEPDPVRFYTEYLPLAARHPLELADAWLHLTYESWYPFSTIDAYNNDALGAPMGYDKTETSVFACMTEEPGVANSKLPALYDVLWKISRYNVLQSNPFTAWLISVPFYVWCALIATARAIIVRSRLRAPCALVILLLLTFALGPCVMTRYYLPLMLAFPLMVCMFLDGGARLAPAKAAKVPRKRGRHGIENA